MNYSRSAITNLVVRLIPVVILFLVVMMLFDATPVIASSSPRINAKPLQDWAWGEEWSPGSTVTMTVDGDGDSGTPEDFCGEGTGEADATGFVSFAVWEFCNDLLPGQWVTMTDDVTTKKLHVQDVVVTLVDSDTDIVSGTATVDSTISVSIHEPGGYNIQTTADGSGNWSVDFTGTYDLIEGVNGDASIFDADGDATRYDFWPPTSQVWANPDGEWIEGKEWTPGRLVTAYVDDDGNPGNGGVVYTADTWAEIDELNPHMGYVRFDLDIDLTAWQYVTLTDGVVTKVHQVTDLVVTEIDVDADTISGTATVDSTISVSVHEPGGGYNIQTTVDGNGNWIVNFSGIYNIQPGSSGEAIQYDEWGNATYKHWSIPTFNVFPITETVHATGWPLGASVTLTIDDPSNGPGTDYTETQIVGAAPWNPDEIGLGFLLHDSFDVQAGHIISLTDGVITKIHTVTNLMITGTNPDTDKVSGTADPGSVIDLFIHGVRGFDLHVTADGNGNWFADYSGIYDLQPGTVGGATEEDEDGDKTWVDWSVPDPKFNVMGVTGTIWFFDFLPNTTLTLTIDDPEIPGSPDYTTTYPSGPEGQGFEFDYDQTYAKPGNIFTLTDDVNTKTHVLQYLDKAMADPVTDTVFGYADVGATVSIHSPWGIPEREIEVTIADGYWEVIYDGEFDIPFQFFGFAEILDIDGDSTRVFWNTVYPYLTVNLTNHEIILRDWPENSNVSVTIQDRESAVVFTGSVDMGSGSWGGSPLTEASLNYGSVEVLDGFTVTATDGVTPKEHVVTELVLIRVDVIADTVNGTAAADSEIWLDIYDMGSRREFAYGSGDWFADFSIHGDEDWEEPYDLTLNSGGDAYQSDDDIDRTMVSWWIDIDECQPGSDITGTVYVANQSNPLEDAVVHFRNVSLPGQDYCGARTSSDGTYGVELPDGMYILFANQDGVYSREYYAETIAENATVLAVSDTVQHSGVDFTLDTPIYSYQSLTFNMIDSVVGDLAVRQAVAYGTDRAAMIAATWPNSPILDSYLAPTHWAYTGTDLPYYDFNPQLAGDILAAAGWEDEDQDGIREKDGVRLHIDYYTNVENPMREAIYQIFGPNMAAIGVEVQVTALPFQELLTQIFELQDFGAYQLGWRDDINDEVDVPWNLFVTGSYANGGHYSNLQADQLVESAAAAMTRAEKLPFVTDHQIIIMTDLPILPLVQGCLYPDEDCDGIIDLVDNAPQIFNPDQSDIDGDGTGDVADICPSDPTDTCNTENSTSESVGSSGGSLSTSQGATVMEIPQNALSEYTSISITDVGAGYTLTSNRGKGTAVFGVEIGPAGTTFDVPVTITLHWEDNDDNGVVDGTSQKERKLFIAKEEIAITEECEIEPNCDMDANFISVEVSSLSEFALVTLDYIQSISAPIEPVQFATVVEVGVSFSDTSICEGHTASFDWGDSTDPEELLPTGTCDMATGSHDYATPGVYTLDLTITENGDEIDTATYQYVVVYDPDGGFVTGGGWFDSPEGAYMDDPLLTGKATFGFVSKYKKETNVPTGETEFQFHAGDLNFHSSSYDWLVVAGAKAQFKGVGTINGEGEYKFMLSAIDAAINENDSFCIDRFRIKIWYEDGEGEEVVYDNAHGLEEDDATTKIAGGNIVIHKAK